jgi:4-amino-4-deoxy-L-arabinose transferase-like glycosyltransferase
LIKSWRTAIVLMALLALFVGIDNMLRPLANPDEGRYSEISREMALSGDWVTPRLNGIKYFEKPPLQYWAGAAAFKVFGFNEFAARIYTALAGLLCLLCVGYTARRLGTLESALITVGVLLASPYFLAMGGIVTLDMGLTAWTTLAVCAFLLAHAGPESDRRRWMLAAWAGMGLAIMSKGLIGIVFPSAAIFLHCLINRDWALLKRLEWLRGGALFLAITVPWHVAVSMANPEFAHFYFVHEHVERFLAKGHRREESWWFFWPILFGGFLPWALMLVPAAWTGWREDGVTNAVQIPAGRGAAFPWRRFAVIWTLFVTIFFSLSSSKLPAYVLPVFPVFALVVGDWVTRTRAATLWKYVLPIVLLLAIAAPFIWGMPERAKSAWTRELYTSARPWIVTGIAVLTVGMAIAAWQLRKGAKWFALSVLVCASVIFVDCFEDGYEALSPRQSGQIVVQHMQPLLKPDMRIYSVKYYDQTIPFYLNRTVTLVGYSDEFSQGLTQEPQHALPTLDAFASDWARPGSAIAIIQPDAQSALAARGMAMRVIYQDERRILVAKP